MSSFVENLNLWGSQFLHLSALMLWQSSLLITIILALDFLFRRKLRPTVRYALWLVVLVRLVLPPSFAFPTGAGWWLRSLAAPQVRHATPVTVTYGPSRVLPAALVNPPALTPPAPPQLSLQGSTLLAASTVAFALSLIVILHSRRMAREARRAIRPPAWLSQLASELTASTGMPRALRIRLIDRPISPAVCGLFRPTILLPCPLVDRLTHPQLRAILLHELAHLQRGDIWVNCIQTLLQILYWWHPLVWLANARIRRLREESVDDKVMVALGRESDAYAPTLIEVARLALNRLAPGIGLVGILESRNTLGRRIKRLLESRPPKRAGLTVASGVAIAAFAAVAVPMGEAPPKANVPETLDDAWPAPTPSESGYTPVALEVRFFTVNSAGFQMLLPEVARSSMPRVISSNELAGLEVRLKQVGAVEQPEAGQLGFDKFSGGRFHWHIANTISNNVITYQTKEADGRTIVTGADAEFQSSNVNWRPLDLTVMPQIENDSLQCLLELAIPEPGKIGFKRRAQVALPPGAILLWAASESIDPQLPGTGISQLVLLQRQDRSLQAKLDRPVTTNSTPPQSQSSTVEPLLKTLKVDNLMQSARQLFESGKFDQAETKAKEALSLAPQNQSALDYLKMVTEARSKSIASSKEPVRGRKAIVKKLESIRLDATFDNQTLISVVRNLNESVKNSDPEKRGIEFMIDPTVPVSFDASHFWRRPGASNRIDPTPPLSLNTNNSSFDVGQVRININPGLINVPLTDVLHAIVNEASESIKYSVQENLIEFSLRGQEAEPLYTRVFKVDADRMAQAIEAQSKGLAKPSRPEKSTITQVLNAPVKNSPDSVVDLSSPGRSIYFNRIQGTLLVHASVPELDRVESLIAKSYFNLFPPTAQIQIQARFVEIPADASSLLGIDSRTKILNESQSKFLSTIKNQSDIETLSSQKITTLSGRQAEMQIADVQTVVNGVKWELPPGLSAPREPLTNTALTPSFLTASIPLGSTLDINPVVHPDNMTITLDVSAKMTEFLGYDGPAISSRTGDTQIPLPHFRTRSMQTTVDVRDGQTLVLANPKVTDISPALGSTNAIGQSQRVKPKLLLVFITTTLVDSTGKPIHPETSKH